MSMSPQNHKALTLLKNHPDRFASQGTVVATWRTYRGRRLGPYYRLTWRENGRQRSIYLGRHSPLVDQVRSLLHQAQTARRMRREARRRAAHFREHVIRPLRQYVQQMFLLFGNGLYVKGSDIGGVKTAGPRLTAADVPEHLIPKFPLPLPSFLTELQPQPQPNPKPERGQETHSSHTNRNRRSSDLATPKTVWPKASSAVAPWITPGTRRTNDPVVGQRPYSPPPQQHSLTERIRKSVDQKCPHATRTRGPPKPVRAS